MSQAICLTYANVSVNRYKNLIKCWNRFVRTLSERSEHNCFYNIVCFSIVVFCVYVHDYG